MSWILQTMLRLRVVSIQHFSMHAAIYRVEFCICNEAFGFEMILSTIFRDDLSPFSNKLMAKRRSRAVYMEIFSIYRHLGIAWVNHFRFRVLRRVDSFLLYIKHKRVVKVFVDTSFSLVFIWFFLLLYVFLNRKQ